MARILQQIKGVFSGWSVAHYLLSSALSAILSLLVGLFRDLTPIQMVVAVILLFIAFASGLAVWRQEHRRGARMIADILDELTHEALSISTQEAAKDWCANVQVALFGTSNDAILILQRITLPIFGEKPSKALIESTLKLASTFLKAQAVRLRKIESTPYVMTDDVRRVVKRQYDDVIGQAKEVRTKEEGQAWHARVLQLLHSTGQALKIPEMQAIAAPLFTEGQCNVHDVIARAVVSLQAASAFLGQPDNREESLPPT